MSEKDNQELIIEFLRSCGWYTMSTDVMIGLKFITPRGRKPTKAESVKRIIFIKACKKLGYTKGQPDIVAIKNNKTICLEVKSNKGSLSPEQKIAQKIIPNYFMVRSIEDVQKVLILMQKSN